MNSDPRPDEGEEMLLSSKDFLSSLEGEEPEKGAQPIKEESSVWAEPPPPLRFHRYSEDETTSHLANRFDRFYCEMIGRIRSLREGGGGVAEEKGRGSGESREGLESIRRMEEELRDLGEELRTERAERMDVQREMCEVVAKNEDSRLFLDLCRFELTSPSSTPQKPPEKLPKKLPKKTPFSLTDEEKSRLEALLEENEANDHLSPNEKNPFLLSRDEEMRVQEIDRELGIENSGINREEWEDRSERSAKGELRRIEEELGRIRGDGREEGEVVPREKGDLPEKKFREGMSSDD